MEKAAMEKLAVTALFVASLLGVVVLPDYYIIFVILAAASLVGYFVIGAKQALGSDEELAKNYARKMELSARGKKPAQNAEQSSESKSAADGAEKPAEDEPKPETAQQ